MMPILPKPTTPILIFELALAMGLGSKKTQNKNDAQNVQTKKTRISQRDKN